MQILKPHLINKVSRPSWPPAAGRTEGGRRKMPPLSHNPILLSFLQLPTHSVNLLKTDLHGGQEYELPSAIHLTVLKSEENVKLQR
jgi:hypothetical protein